MKHIAIIMLLLVISVPTYAVEHRDQLSSLNNKALNLFNSDHLNEAIIVWTEAYSIIRDNEIVSSQAAEIINNLGYAYYKKNDFVEAEKTLLFSKNIKPRRWSVHLNLGDLYSKNGERKKAVDSYMMMLELNENYKYNDRILHEVNLHKLYLEPIDSSTQLESVFNVDIQPILIKKIEEYKRTKSSDNMPTLKIVGGKLAYIDEDERFVSVFDALTLKHEWRWFASDRGNLRYCDSDDKKLYLYNRDFNETYIRDDNNLVSMIFFKALDLTKNKEAWSTRVNSKIDMDHANINSIICQGSVFNELYALEPETGKLFWRTNVRLESPTKKNDLHAHSYFILTDGKASVFAVSKKNGETLKYYKTAYDPVNSYAETSDWAGYQEVQIEPDKQGLVTLSFRSKYYDGISRLNTKTGSFEWTLSDTDIDLRSYIEDSENIYISTSYEFSKRNKKNGNIEWIYEQKNKERWYVNLSLAHANEKYLYCIYKNKIISINSSNGTISWAYTFKDHEYIASVNSKDGKLYLIALNGGRRSTDETIFVFEEPESVVP